VDGYGDDVLFFVWTWAEAVIRQLDRVRTTQQKWADDFRAADRMEEWGPIDDVLERNFRIRWTEEHTLIWAVHQLVQWSRRLAVERGEDPAQQDDSRGSVAALVVRRAAHCGVPG
jgi:hypothetical protein